MNTPEIKELCGRVITKAVRHHRHDTPLVQRLADIEITMHETFAPIMAHHSAQLQQLGGRVKELEGALQKHADILESAEIMLRRCTAYAPNDEKIEAIMRVVRRTVEAQDSTLALLRPAQEQATKASQ